MKANAPEKIYLTTFGFPLCEPIPQESSNPDTVWSKKPYTGADSIEYTRTDAFIEKALKWYCLDCACNDNCASNHKCAFWSFFKDYLEGNEKALPPKISNAFNPDGSTTENYRYRHIIERMQDDFIEKACKFLYKYNQKQVQKHGPKATLGCGEYTINVENFRKYMKGE